MLVVTRKVGEVVEIEGVGQVHIVRVRGNLVRIGFEIAKGIRVVRAEKLPFAPPEMDPPADQGEK
jgi:carbon storage regulator CsrA